jgi:rod shape determining protein RodA
MRLLNLLKKDPLFVISIFFVISLSTFVLKAIAPEVFPGYFFYILLSIFVFILFSELDFEVLKLFSKHLYAFCVLLLLATFVIGRVTRGTIRWIPIGPFSLQPAEIIRPFLILFFADYLGDSEITSKKLLKTLGFLAVPVFLIMIQPSLSVSIITIVGFLGVVIAKKFDKSYLLKIFVLGLMFIPLFWFVMRPYQRDRISAFVKGGSDPQGAGYNSIQSMIAVGSGKIFGRNLGKGVQTQLAYLPEKKTDFIFAAVSEELGFIGSFLVLLSSTVLLFRLTTFMKNAVSPSARAYISGFLATFFIGVFVHVGMNLGLLPVTGIPYPLLSAGGSSLLATMTGLGIALNSYRNSR